MSPSPSSPPSGKKNRFWVWALTGCGGLTLIGGVILIVVVVVLLYIVGHVAENPVRSAARVIEMTNPDIEIISVDEEKEMVTFRDKKTGQVTTVSLEEARKKAESGSTP